jgi:hypothetical protein
LGTAEWAAKQVPLDVTFKWEFRIDWKFKCCNKDGKWEPSGSGVAKRVLLDNAGFHNEKVAGGVEDHYTVTPK